MDLMPYVQRVIRVPFPNVKQYKEKRWQEFQQTPLPAGTTPAKIKELEQQHHEDVKNEIRKLKNACEENFNCMEGDFQDYLKNYYGLSQNPEKQTSYLYDLARNYALRQQKQPVTDQEEYESYSMENTRKFLQNIENEYRKLAGLLVDELPL